MSTNKRSTFLLIAIVIGIVAILLLDIIFFSKVENTQKDGDADNSVELLQNANEAFLLVLEDQKDGALVNGTVIELDGKYFAYHENELVVLQDSPDVSAAITVATVDESRATVYLLRPDGEITSYHASFGITYHTLLDFNGNPIKTYTYSQVNQAAQKFLEEVTYASAADTESEIAKYIKTSGRYDRPIGCTVELEAGELTVFDNGTRSKYTVTVQKGPYTFYNITPGVGGEFYVMNGDAIIQQGHLRPTGTLKMIYSDTHGLQNMRDLGGWSCDGGTVKYNLMIRGGAVIDAIDADRSTWVKLLDIKHDLFLKTYYDSQLEGREEYRTKSPLGDNVAFYQKDLSSEDSENKRNFAQAKEQMNSIINYLFDSVIAGETVYFHCLAGADRTGMVAIIVEGVLGVSKNDIDKDYELTSFNCLRERNNAGYVGDINVLRGYAGDTFRDKCIRYLLDCGISLEKINAFRNAAIDGSPEPIIEIELGIDPIADNLCVPKGEGWIDGGRCSSTGADRFDAAHYTVTNYFPAQSGDIVYVKNLHIANTLCSGIYRSDKTAIAGFMMNENDGAEFVKDINVINGWESFAVVHAEAGYFRLCGAVKPSDAEVVVHVFRNGKWLKIGS